MLFFTWPTVPVAPCCTFNRVASVLGLVISLRDERCNYLSNILFIFR